MKCSAVGREKFEALRQNPALVGLKERAAEQVSKLRQRGAGGAAQGAAELEAQLEKAAGATKAAPALVELHRQWVAQCAAGKEGAFDDGDGRLLCFREVLLRSRALELTVEAVATDAALCRLYADSGGEEPLGPTALQTLLSKTLACPAELWSDVFRAAVAVDGELCGAHGAWLTGVVASVKADWQEEALGRERRELALQAEYLRQELQRPEAAGEPGGVPEAAAERGQRRVALSADLLRTYGAVRENLEEARARRQKVALTREADLGLIAEQVQAHLVVLHGAAERSAGDHRQLEGEMAASQESIKQQLQTISDKRAEIDSELAALEARKLALKMELDQVSRELDEARMHQRQHMEGTDVQRQELEKVKTEFQHKISVEVSAVQAAEGERLVVERARGLVSSADAAVQQLLGAQVAEMKKKQAQFDSHFQELLKDHIAYAEAQAEALHSRADACMQKGDGVFDIPGEVAERRRVYEAADAACGAHDTFRQDHAASMQAAGEDVQAAAQRAHARLSAVVQRLARAGEVQAVAVAPPDAAPEVAAPDSSAAAPPAAPVAHPAAADAEANSASCVSPSAEAAVATAPGAPAPDTEAAFAPVARAAATAAAPAPLAAAAAAPSAGATRSDF